MIPIDPAHAQNASDSMGGEPLALTMRLTDIFDRSCVQSVLPSIDKSAVIRQLANSLAQANRIRSNDVAPLVDALIDRERLMSSAFGKGFAFPHVRSRLVDTFVGAVGVTPHGMDLASFDGLPTKIVVLTVSPWEQRDQHLSLLSRLVNIANDKKVHLHMDHEFCPSDIWHYMQELDQRMQPPEV